MSTSKSNNDPAEKKVSQLHYEEICSEQGLKNRMK
jgi:hypothetical protein